jgi:hypothetical protein
MKIHTTTEVKTTLLLLTKSKLRRELVTMASFQRERPSRDWKRTPPHAYRQEASIGEEVKNHKINEEGEASRTFVRIML